MGNILVLDGREYVSTKKASEETGYAKDYIGQLARGRLIDAQRVGGLWYVSLRSLLDYQRGAAAYSPRVERPAISGEPDATVSLDGRDYISASRASKLTGYHPDYVGQLARSGKVLSRQIGHRWYVDKEALLRHKEEKDSLLAAVQAQSVGLVKNQHTPGSNPPYESSAHAFPLMTYHAEHSDLLPVLKPKLSWQKGENTGEDETLVTRHVVNLKERAAAAGQRSDLGSGSSVITMGRAIYFVGALTFVVVLSYGMTLIDHTSRFASHIKAIVSGTSASQSPLAQTASAALSGYLEALSDLLSDEVTFSR